MQKNAGNLPQYHTQVLGTLLEQSVVEPSRTSILENPSSESLIILTPLRRSNIVWNIFFAIKSLTASHLKRTCLGTSQIPCRIHELFLQNYKIIERCERYVEKWKIQLVSVTTSLHSVVSKVLVACDDYKSAQRVRDSKVPALVSLPSTLLPFAPGTQ